MSTTETNKKNSRYTVGFLDENAYTENQGYITLGISEAAKKYDLNVIRFGHFDSHSTSRSDYFSKMVLDHIQQYELNALLFLGWARAANFENHANFRKRFSGIPIFSVGKGFPDIPHTFFPGGVHIRQILDHLINVHGYKRIAFIAPFNPDARKDVYLDTMKEYGIFDEKLYISENDVADLDLPSRGRKALSVLIDERKIKVEAIVSLYNDESKGLIEEIESRGLKVPDNIAVTSYEDGEIARFSSPTLTTVYFPFKELGFQSCEKIYQLLDTGSVSISNLIPGRVIWRESCGCMQASLTASAAGKIASAGKTLTQLTDAEIFLLERSVRYSTCCSSLNVLTILFSFIDNFRGKTSNYFLLELEKQFDKLEQAEAISDIENFISTLRKVLLPYLLPYIKEDINSFLWAEDLFQQAQVLLLDRKSGAWARAELRSKSVNLILQQISQKLVDNFTMDNLMNSLESELPALKIPSCYIFIFKNPEENENPFDHSVLAFEYTNYKRVRSKITTCQAKQKLAEMLFPEDRPYLMMGNLLYVGQDVIGFALFEPGPVDERIYQTLAMHISTALYGVILMEKLDNSYKNLVDQAHRKGMADVASGILHNIGNILNSINVSTHIIKDLVNSSPIKDLFAANSLLEKHMNDIENFILNDEKGKKLMQFYVKLESPISGFRAQILNNVERMINNITVVDEIITAQNTYAGIKLSMEETDIVTILEDALKLSSISFEKKNIKVIRDYRCKTANAFVQKTKLFHVLVNIINNAAEAMLSVSEKNRFLRIIVDETADQKVICIRDTGCGIRPYLLESIFAYGYTTRKDGHGFGLHSCANYMTEMGGKIWAESDGPGKGAKFILQLKAVHQE